LHAPVKTAGRRDDDLDEDERVRLHAEVDASIAEAGAGATEDFGRRVSELRQRP
jgi:hypothetical protein